MTHYFRRGLPQQQGPNHRKSVCYMSDISIQLLQREGSKYSPSKRMLIMESYDPFQIPPDITLAINHGLANRTCKAPKSIPNDNQDVCPCCHLPIHNQLLPVSCKIKEFAHVGVAYAFYFEYIKMCFVLVVANIILSGLAQLILNSEGTMCQKLHNTSFICKGSVINILNVKDTTLVRIQNVLSCFFILVSFLMIEAFKLKQSLFKRKYKSKQFLIEDYSLILSRLPADTSIETVGNLINTLLEKSDCTDNEKVIVKIYFLFNISEYISLYEQEFESINIAKEAEVQYENQKKELMKPASRISKHDLLDEVENQLKELSLLKQNTQDIKQKIHQFEDNFHKEYSKILDGSKSANLLFSGKCIVTLNSVKARKFISQNCKENTIQKCYNPTDFIYKNLAYPENEDTKKMTKRHMLFLILALIGDFFILTLLKKFIKVEQATAINQLLLIGMSAASSIICCGFNTLLGIMIRHFARKDRTFTTMSDYFTTVGNQLTNIFMINMLATTYFSNLISFWVISYGESTYPHFPLNFLGLIYDFFFLFITNSYMSSVMSYFDIVWGWRLYWRRRIAKELTATQSEANNFYEGHPIDLALRYANVNKAILISAAMAPIIPIGLQFTLLALVILYWIDKWLFLRRFVCKHKLNNRFSRQIMRQLQLYPLFMSFFNLVIMFIPVEENNNSQSFIDKFIYPNNQNSFAFYLAIIMFILAIWYKFSKWGILKRSLRKIFGESFKVVMVPDQDLYLENTSKFAEDYSDHYPYFKVTKTEQGKYCSSDRHLFQHINRSLEESRFAVKE